MKISIEVSPAELQAFRSLWAKLCESTAFMVSPDTADEPVPGGVKHPDGTYTVGTTSTDKPARASRRKANAIGAPEGEQPLTEEGKAQEVAETALVDPTPAATPSRRRGASAGTPSPTPEPATPSAPTAQTPASTATTADPAPAPSAVQSRRRTASTASPETASAPSATTTSPSDDKVEDSDLAKAASMGARALTPRVVTEFLTTLGVTTVGELQGTMRRHFITAIHKMIDEAKK